jgi:hypothetical protein
MGSFISGASQAVGNTIGALGGLTNGIAQGFTPQNTFQASNPLNTTALGAQMSAAQGNLAQNTTNQNQLAQALLAQSQGQGPNPAQQMLNQSTNQNIQQNAGLIASQKGINPALAAQLASQNQAQISQQAAGQGALMGAQQQIAAQSGLGQLYGQIGTQNLQNQYQSGQLVNQDVNGTNQINSGVASGNAAATQSSSSGLLGGISGGVAGGAKSGTASGALQGIAGQWGGGAVGYSDGGIVNDAISPAPVVAEFLSGGGSVPKHLHAVAQIYHPNFQAKGTEQLKAKGGGVPGKAKVPGDSPRNDTVKTMLSPGEEVLPRSVMQSKDPAQAAYDFVANELKKRGADTKGDFKQALKMAIGSRRGK